jgi:hypothetical protein
MSLAYRFFVAGVAFALIGLGLGTYMGSTHDFAYAPVHAHINLVGFVTHFLFGLYYRSEPANASGWLPQLQFLAAVLGGILLPLGILGAVTGQDAVDVAVIPGTILTLLSMILFFAVVLRGWRRHATARPAPASAQAVALATWSA